MEPVSAPGPVFLPDRGLALVPGSAQLWDPETNPALEMASGPGLRRASVPGLAFPGSDSALGLETDPALEMVSGPALETGRDSVQPAVQE